MAAARAGRSAASYRRRGPVREPYDVVLIVCEGEKTEPRYFSDLRTFHRLSSANIRVTPADGTDPVSIVEFATTEIERGNFDRAFCVFDRNGHANFDVALRRIAQSDAGRAGQLRAITSWPCFEVWLLLHFAYSTRPFERTGRESACDRVLRQLRPHSPAYAKGRAGIFEELTPLLAAAMRNAEQLQTHNRATNSQNPATAIHELVGYLTSLKAG